MYYVLWSLEYNITWYICFDKLLQAGAACHSFAPATAFALAGGEVRGSVDVLPEGF